MALGRDRGDCPHPARNPELGGAARPSWAPPSCRGGRGESRPPPGLGRRAARVTWGRGGGETWAESRERARRALLRRPLTAVRAAGAGRGGRGEYAGQPGRASGQCRLPERSLRVAVHFVSESTAPRGRFSPREARPRQTLSASAERCSQTLSPELLEAPARPSWQRRPRGLAGLRGRVLAPDRPSSSPLHPRRCPAVPVTSRLAASLSDVVAGSLPGMMGGWGEPSRAPGGPRRVNPWRFFCPPSGVHFSQPPLPLPFRCSFRRGG